MNHNNSSRFTSFVFGGPDYSSSNLSRTLSNPVAESTKLDRGVVKNSRSLFESPLKQGSNAKRKPTSPLQNSKTSFKSTGNLSTLGLNRVDPQTYTDAQSRGLVNRIIKYHEKLNSPLNRSQSMTNLYTKPGQFPVVHLKKTEIKYSPRRNNSISSVRIAPPEKSVFQTNTRSNILRAGSLLIPAESHLKTGAVREESIDAENRVIAPSTEIEAAPTRSVLDALKEISRKRINSEELDADRIKKQCKELSEVDSGGGGTGVKRARELPSSTSPPSRATADQQHLQKKRLCQKNNDILSSLSSSLVMHTPKRLENIQPRPGRLNVDQSFSNTVTPGSLNIIIAPEGQFSNKEAAKLSRIESAPLPMTSKNVPDVQVPVVKPVQQKITLFNKKYDTTQIRPLSPDSDEQEDDDECNGRISFIKPKQKSPVLNSEKVTLKRVEKSKLSLLLSCLSEDFDEVDSPKETNKTIALKNDSISPIQKDEKKDEPKSPKLSGIAALINSPIKDPGFGKIETSKLKITEEQPKSTASFATNATSIVSTVSSNATTTKLPDTTITFGTPVKSSDVNQNDSKKQENSFSFGTPTTAPPVYSVSTVVTTAVNTSLSTTTVASSVTSTISATTGGSSTANLISFSPAPVTNICADKSGFTLSPTKSTTSAVKNVLNSNQPIQTNITLGSGSAFSAYKPQVSLPNSTVSTVVTTNTSAPVQQFGSKTNPALVSNTTGFTFGGSQTTFETTAVTTAPPVVSEAAKTSNSSTTFGGFATTTTTPSAPFSFGTNLNTTSTIPKTGTVVADAVSFGGFGNASTSISTTNNTSVTTASNTFSFGNSSTTTTTNLFCTSSSPKTTFAANQPVQFGQSSGVNNTVSFGFRSNTGSSQPTVATTQANHSAFTFGGGALSSNQIPASTQVVSNTTTTPSFGSVATSAANSNVNTTFGGMVTTSGTPSFGSIANNSNTPAFGNPIPTLGANSSTFGVSPPQNNATSGFGTTGVFGANNSTLAAPVFGASSAPVGSPFGTSNATPAASGGIFGSASVTPSTNQQTAPNNTPFAFGGSTGTTVPTSPTYKPFTFGGGVTNTSNTTATALNKSNTFAFSAGTNSAAAPQTNPLTDSSASFNFAAPSNNSNIAPNSSAFGSASSGFSFSANSANNSNNISTTNQAVVKPFSFGTNSNNNQNTNVFGNSAMASATSPPAFNFSAGTNNPGSAFNFNPAATPTVGTSAPFSMPNGATGMTAPGGAPMFSIGTGGNPQRRPIRTATRRYK